MRPPQLRILAEGLFWVLYCGWVLFLERNPHAPWLRHLWWVSLPLLLLILVSLIGNLGGMEPSGGVGSRNMTRSTTRCKQAGLLTLLMALWGCVLWYFRERPWAVIGAGVVVAIHVRGLGKLRGRSHLIAVVGWRFWIRGLISRLAVSAEVRVGLCVGRPCECLAVRVALDRRSAGASNGARRQLSVTHRPADCGSSGIRSRKGNRSSRFEAGKHQADSRRPSQGAGFRAGQSAVE
jgi:hypothetical protein